VPRRPGAESPRHLQPLTQIAPRTGDDGSAGVGDGDEFNSGLGVLLAEPLPADARELLLVMQHELPNLGCAPSIAGSSS